MRFLDVVLVASTLGVPLALLLLPVAVAVSETASRRVARSSAAVEVAVAVAAVLREVRAGGLALLLLVSVPFLRGATGADMVDAATGCSCAVSVTVLPAFTGR